MRSNGRDGKKLYDGELESWEEFSRMVLWKRLLGFPFFLLARLRDIVIDVVMLPLSLGLFGRDEPEPWDESTRPGQWKRVLFYPFILPVWIARGVIEAVTFPFYSETFATERRRMLLWGLPAVICMAMVLTGIIYIWFNNETIKGRYFQRMQEAIANKDFNLASVLAERVIQQSSEVDPMMRLRYAMILSEKGDHYKAIAIIDDLAPDDKIGFAGAHQHKAARLGEELQTRQDTEKLKKFRWHLDHANMQSSEQFETLWALYYSIVDQNDKVIEHLERASRSNPSHLIKLSEIYHKNGNFVGAERTLVSAEAIFDKKLRDDPFAKAVRLQLALIKSKLRRVEEAEQILLTGVALNGDAEMRRSTADFYLMRYDLLRKEKQPFEKQFVFLQKSISLDSTYIPAYDRLVSLYANCPDKESLQEMKKLLRDMIVEGKSAAMAHVALGSILLLDGDSKESQSHLRQAFKLDTKMPVVCNNLAWLLVNSADSKQLDEAYQLATQAVAAQPNNAEFRDTLGLVLMKQEKYEEAITEFEKILPAAGSKNPVHRNLAICYQKLGRLEMAKSHADKSK